MKLNHFTLGAIAGVTSLALAIPLLVQISSAQSAPPSSQQAGRPTLSQSCVEAIANLEEANTANLDTVTAARKTAMQAHADAMKAASAITDDAQRQAAVQKANQDFRTAMQAVMQSKADAVKTQTDAVKTACGGSGKGGMFMMGGHKGFGRMGHGPRGERGGWMHGPMGSSTSSVSSAQ